MIQAPGPGPDNPDPVDLELEVRQAYRDHAPAVRRSALRAAQGDTRAAEDATQEAFMQAIAIWPQFRQWPTGKQRGWLCTAARHRVIDSWRASRAQVPGEMLLYDDQASCSPEDIVVSDMALDRFWKLVTDMPSARAGLPTCDGTRNGP